MQALLETGLHFGVEYGRLLSGELGEFQGSGSRCLNPDARSGPLRVGRPPDTRPMSQLLLCRAAFARAGGGSGGHQIGGGSFGLNCGHPHDAPTVPDVHLAAAE